MISISTSNLALCFGADTILEDVTFAVEDGDKVGIVGVNGSGKSTLFRLIKGEYTPSDGNIFIAKDKKVGLLEQDDAFNITKKIGDAEIGDTVLEQMYAAFPDLFKAEARLAVLEKYLHDNSEKSSSDEYLRAAEEYTNLNNLYIENGGMQYKSRCVSLLDKLGFDESFHALPVSKLSGGQRTRLALARLLSQEPDILMLDEPTNHLDIDTMVWLENHLASYKKTVLLVSHDRYFLDRITNKIIEIEYKVGKLYNGNYTQYVNQKEFDRAAQEKQYKNQQKEIARIEAYIAQQRAWNRERNIIAAESREKALARMTKIEKPKNAPKSIKFSFTGSGESGNDVLYVKDLKMGFGSRELFSDLSFLVKKRERVFISGANGCGKSTLIKLLMGILTPLDGKIEYGYNVTVGYYDQENQNLDPNKTVLDELWDEYSTLTQTEIRNTLAMFLFRGDDIEKKVSVLSGGERARLTLAKLILSKMNLLILDEPTNHLDINSREALETALLGFDGTIIAVSHDRYFTQKLATRIIEIDNKNGCHDYLGGYDSYLIEKERFKAQAESSSVSSESDNTELTSTKEKYLASRQDAARLRKQQRRRQQIADEIKKLESELTQIDEELFGEAATDYVRAAELDENKTKIEERLMELYGEEESFSKID